jgi:hypothetical protein
MGSRAMLQQEQQQMTLTLPKSQVRTHGLLWDQQQLLANPFGVGCR